MKTSLLILGVLHRGDFHPYEIKRRLENAMVECYSDVDTGTLYYAIKQLEKDGLIVAVSQERVARGGMRTVYAITPKGRKVLAAAERWGGGEGERPFLPRAFSVLRAPAGANACKSGCRRPASSNRLSG